MDNGRIIAEGSPRELIRRAHRAGSGRGLRRRRTAASGPRRKAWAASPPASRSPARRVLLPTESRPLLAALADRHGLRYLHRPANLEDVFLKLTGRDLRD
jgi:lipooligosaccharide transport system ATP-binding protein